MIKLNELLHDQLDSFENKEEFWGELMNFVEEQLKHYSTRLKQSGLDLSLLKNMQTDESVGRNLRQIKDYLIVLSKWNQNQEEQAKKVNQLEEKLNQQLGVAIDLEVQNKELQRKLEQAKDYLDEQKKKINTAKIKSEKELSNKLGIVRDRIQVINEMVHVFDQLQQDDVNNIQSKVSDEIQKIVEVMSDSGVWPEDEEKPLPILIAHEKIKKNKTEVVNLVNEEVESVDEVVATSNGEVESENGEVESANEVEKGDLKEITSVQDQIENNSIIKDQQLFVVEKQSTDEKQMEEVKKKKTANPKKQSKSTSNLASVTTKDGNN